MKYITPKFLIVSVYAFITILFRTSLHLGPNIETVTAFALLLGMLLNWKQAAFMVIAIMIITDLIIGNTSIFIFTWTGFLIPLVIAKLVINKKLFSRNANFDLLLAGLTGGIVSTLFFYIWTNFGVVVLTDMYPKTIEGLMQSYINALPFLKLQIAGNMIFSPVFLISAKLLLSNKQLLSLQVNKK
jgi:hypothetical protein